MPLFYGRADRTTGSVAGRGIVAGRYADPLDAALAESAKATLCAYHERAAMTPPRRVRAGLWRGLVARAAMLKCVRCRNVERAETRPLVARAETRAAIRCKGWNGAETGHGTIITNIGRGTRDVSDTACGPCLAFMLGTIDAAARDVLA